MQVVIICEHKVDIGINYNFLLIFKTKIELISVLVLYFLVIHCIITMLYKNI